MVKKRKVNKTHAVRDYLKAHPKATSGEIATALSKQGTKITASYAANIKTTIKKTRTAKKVAKKSPVVTATAAAVEKPVKAADTVTIEQVRAVAQTLKVLGGADRLNALLGLIKEVGGLKKFRELLDAISGIPTNAIPF